MLFYVKYVREPGLSSRLDTEYEMMNEDNKKNFERGWKQSKKERKVSKNKSKGKRELDITKILPVDPAPPTHLSPQGITVLKRCGIISDLFILVPKYYPG